MLSPCSQGPAGCRVAEQHWNAVPAPKLADTDYYSLLLLLLLLLLLSRSSSIVSDWLLSIGLQCGHTQKSSDKADISGMRSVETWKLVPCARSTYSARSFAVAGPNIRNSLAPGHSGSVTLQSRIQDTAKDLPVWMTIVALVRSNWCLRNVLTYSLTYLLIYLLTRRFDGFPSVLRHCQLGDRKGSWPVKSWALVCWCWRFNRNFARLMAPVVTATSIILSSNKILNGEIHPRTGFRWLSPKAAVSFHFTFCSHETAWLSAGWSRNKSPSVNLVTGQDSKWQSNESHNCHRQKMTVTK